MIVGTRELKNRLSYYLRRVREGGEPVQVTDRGEVIAEIHPAPPPGGDPDRQALLALAANDELAIGAGRFDDFKPIRRKRGTSLSRHVIRDRR